MGAVHAHVGDLVVSLMVGRHLVLRTVSGRGVVDGIAEAFDDAGVESADDAPLVGEVVERLEAALILVVSHSAIVLVGFRIGFVLSFPEIGEVFRERSDEKEDLL